jgi:hypothetical protein
MSPCRFQFDFPGSSESLVQKIRQHVASAGGTFDGSSTDGTFALATPVGSFRGTYRIERSTIFLEVADRPFFVPCGAIEARLAEYVKTAVR